MRKFIQKKKKISLALITSLFLNSCGVTQKLWEPRVGGDTISSFFLDNKQNRVVLIGNERDENGNDHYSLTDKNKTIYKLFELGAKSQQVDLHLLHPSTTGKKLRGTLSIAIGKKNLSQDEVKFLINLMKFNATNLGNNKDWVAGVLTVQKEMTRYPSSQESFKNICSEVNKDSNCSPITKLHRPWQGIIQNHYTNSETAIKLTITPFAIVADVLLSPLYAIVYIMANQPSK